MTHTLYKPHVHSPQAQITTPDLLIDAVTVAVDGAEHKLPVHRVVQRAELQLAPLPYLVSGGIAVIAAGGGAIAAPALMLRRQASPLEDGDLLLSREAVRVRALDAAPTKLALTGCIGVGPTIEYTGDISLPGDYSDAGKNAIGEPALPRGTCRVFLAAMDPVQGEGGATVALAVNGFPFGPFRIRLVPMDQQSQARETGRYAVGPVGDVDHYI